MSGANGNTPTVPIAVVPTIFAVTQVPGPDGRPMVALMISTPTGQSVHLMSADCAISTGQNLRQAGKASAAGLIVPEDRPS